jgi:hypothetical protein
MRSEAASLLAASMILGGRHQRDIRDADPALCRRSLSGTTAAKFRSRRAVRALFDRRFWLPALAAICACALLSAVRAAAQQPEAQAAPGDTLLSTFYRDPRPERLIGFLDRLRTSPSMQSREAYPLIAGFFAVVFRLHPDDVEKLMPQSLDARTAETIAAALRLSGNRAKYQGFEPRLAATGRDLDVAGLFVNLPSRFEELQITAPSSLNILWGAAFASGDATFVRMILDYFARTANLDDEIGRDIVQTVAALTGGPRDIFLQMRQRYGVLGARRVVFAAEALWSLQANAGQHAFVNDVVAKYVAEHPGTPAEKALIATRPKGP